MKLVRVISYFERAVNVGGFVFLKDDLFGKKLLLLLRHNLLI